MSERLPAFRRFDISGSYYHRFSAAMQAVFYASLSNVLDRENVYGYRYSRDYRERAPVRSIFNRSLYFGASLIRS